MRLLHEPFVDVVAVFIANSQSAKLEDSLRSTTSETHPTDSHVLDVFRDDRLDASAAKMSSRVVCGVDLYTFRHMSRRSKVAADWRHLVNQRQ